VEVGVSLVSKVAGVRMVMVEQQQKLAQDGKIVMAGRDIGTTVLPHAQLKIYLSASSEERARRRYLEVIERGEAADYQTILAELVRRDEIDSQRSISPLEPATDAKMVDTDGLNPDQVLAGIIRMTE
jgi:cytidylate kinase